jgi:drug/metabolite transporter (DMT)-like permease
MIQNAVIERATARIPIQTAGFLIGSQPTGRTPAGVDLVTPNLARMQRIWAAMIVASLGWGTAGVATRIALDNDVTPYRLAAYRATLAVLLVALYVLVRRRGLPKGEAAWKVGIVMGTTNLAAPFIFITLALQYVGAGFIGLMTALIPLMTAAVAHFTPLEERLSVPKTLGLLIGFSGVAVLLLSGDSGLAEGGNPVLGALLGLGSVTSISVGSLYAKYRAGEYDSIDVAGIQHALGALVIIVIMLFVEGGPRVEPGVAWAALGYMALMSSLLPMLLYYWLYTQVSATYASLAGYIIPPIAIVAGVVVLDEQLQAGIILGGVLIFIGVLLADRAERAPLPAPADA